MFISKLKEGRSLYPRDADGNVEIEDADIVEVWKVSYPLHCLKRISRLCFKIGIFRSYRGPSVVDNVFNKHGPIIIAC